MLLWLILLTVWLAALVAGAVVVGRRLGALIVAEIDARAAEDVKLNQAVMTIEGRRNRLLHRIKVAQAAADPAVEDRHFHRYAVVNGKVVDTRAPDAGT